MHQLSESGTTDQLSLSVVNQDTLASAYAYGDARMNDEVDGLAFPSDDDQRHTLNAVGRFVFRGRSRSGPNGIRFAPSIGLSVQF